MHCTQVGQQLGYITVNNMCFAWGWGWVEAGAALPPSRYTAAAAAAVIR